MIGVGFGFIGFSLLGKSFIRFYRYVKAGENVTKAGANLLGKYYKGAFLPSMSTREASLILGIRESADQAKIMNSHRKLMFLNHPDNGGTTYLATKINEAKEVLMEGEK